MRVHIDGALRHVSPTCLFVYEHVPVSVDISEANRPGGDPHALTDLVFATRSAFQTIHVFILVSKVSKELRDGLINPCILSPLHLHGRSHSTSMDPYNTPISETEK